VTTNTHLSSIFNKNQTKIYKLLNLR